MQGPGRVLEPLLVDVGPQEIAKSTSSMTLGAVSARNSWNGNASSAAATKPIEIR
jgi:hypothetical protein